MLIDSLIDYKTGYYVTFQINAKGKPNSVIANIESQYEIHQNKD